MSNWEKYLKDIYLDPSHPASFGSPDHLYKIVKKEGKHKISHSQIKKCIQKQESYSLNKGLKRKFQRGRVVVEGIDDQLDIDLASLIYYADDNDGYKYLLVVIDICDSFRALAAVSPGCLVTVVKSHRTWILLLCFHPPTQCNANGSPQGSHLNPPSNGVSAPARVPRMRTPPKFSIKAVHATAQGSLLVSRWLSHI